MLILTSDKIQCWQAFYKLNGGEKQCYAMARLRTNAQDYATLYNTVN